MLSFLPACFKGLLASVLLAANTLLLAPLLLTISLSRFLIPLRQWKHFCTRQAIRVAELWMTINSGWLRLTQPLNWQITGVNELDHQQWYLVTANHQSWADIFILQHLLNRNIPMMKFFLKQELIWVPIIGLCWWALDFPFMKRYSPEYLAKHRDKRGKDLESTQRACEKFKHTPVTIFNFLEGTRFTAEKHQAQKSPYRHLLRPRTAGIAYVVGAMGSQLNCLLDITIAYPDQHRPSFFGFLCGEVDNIVVSVVTRDIPADFLGRDYGADRKFRSAFKQWVHDIWHEKDQQLEQYYQPVQTHAEAPRAVIPADAMDV